MLFYLLQNFDNIKRAVINDVNEKLIVTYMTIKKNPEKLISALSDIERKYFDNDEEGKKDFFYGVREKFNKCQLSDEMMSSYLIFLNRTCFNGLYRVNSNGYFNVPFGRYKNPKICDTETILADSTLLQKVEIMCGDFESTAKHITKNTLYYFDPPYRPLDTTSSFTAYAKGDFDDDDQIRLKQFLDNISTRGCSFMLSNADCRGKNPEDTFLDDLYSNYTIERIIASRMINANASKRGKLTELLVRNYQETQACDNWIMNKQYNYKFTNILDHAECTH
jgi:DNA adenine methylase